MHPLFTDDFRDIGVSEGVQNIIFIYNGSTLFSTFISFFWGGVLFRSLLEDVVGDALVEAEDLIFEEVLTGWGVDETDHFWVFTIEVGFVVILIANILSWLFKFSNIYSCSACPLLQEKCKFI